MKTLLLPLNLKSFALGALTTGGLLLMVNFKPVDKPQPAPDEEIRRYQIVVSDKQTIILDTKTGRFIFDNAYRIKPQWRTGDFDAIRTESAESRK